MRPSWLAPALLAVILALSSCGPPGAAETVGLQDAGNGSEQERGVPSTMTGAGISATPSPQADVRLPEDDAPHDALTEWWYYTGHLLTTDGVQYGFEFVVFQLIRGENPIGYLAHFAVTDPQRDRFHYAARSDQRPEVPPTLDIAVGEWTLAGEGGHDRISAAMNDYALDLSLIPEKPATLHHGGLISYGPAGDSYYYSRTRMAATGTMRVGDRWHQVAGQVWFDHQWGNFIVSPLGGWDWYSVQLDDGHDLMLSVLRGTDGQRSGAFGTLVKPNGRALELGPDVATVEATGSWVSPHTGVAYPSGWRIAVSSQPEDGIPTIELSLSPVLLDQELAFDEMAYWEGAVSINGVVAGEPVDGWGYVELTGYDAR
ncbi:MAG: hypothetical protein GEU73_06440 [Chloroflexi bacterium]|nr:hypothetical protein [Chloroflexota bacterium]